MRLTRTHFSYFKTIFLPIKTLLILSIFLYSFIINAAETEPKLEQTYKIIPGSSIQAFQFKLQNGLQFFIVPDHRNPVATIHFILDAGSNRESKGTTGLAHFFEHMMFRKSVGAPEGNYDKVLNSFGGSGNAGTSDSYVTFYSSFPSPALEQMLKLEANRFLNLDITEPYFSIEKGAVISERKLRVENDPFTRSSEIIRAITERNTPLEWITIGSKQDVENMSIENAKTFYKNFYTPDNTTIFIGGPFDPKKVANLVQKYFGSWKGNLKVTHQKFPADYLTRDLGKKFVCGAPINSQKYKINYPSFSKNINDLVNVIIFKTLLDDHPDGRFERRLVKEKIATDFSFYKVFWQNQSNPLLATFSLSNEQKFENALKFWENGVKEVLNKPISEKIKKQILKQLAVSNAETAEKMTNLVNTIFEDVFFLKNINSTSQIEKLVKSASTTEFRKWVTVNLANKNNYITGIVPTGKAESCQDLYTNFYKK
ncbi:pitrilysin family protein [Pigmentibacter sp. JX0631]|uniref:M16 family metallopeptidase n=1 Tax=Pigmentibacter sp. JX0631 TaxID=2976982 RepID=UPI002469875E|nr:pitrilysin family protein [Pigmentibacter sp. JX0631]WGL59497.1 pitrilysin family protein [Pigmentibacter sp. JX0631]